MLRHAPIPSVTTHESPSTESENAFAAVRWGHPLRHESWEKRRSYDQCFSVGPDAGRSPKRSAANAEARYSTARWSNIPSLGFARVPSNGTVNTEIACEFRGASRSRRRRIHFRPILSGPITYRSQEQGLDAFSFGQAVLGVRRSSRRAAADRWYRRRRHPDRPRRLIQCRAPGLFRRWQSGIVLQDRKPGPARG